MKRVKALQSGFQQKDLINQPKTMPVDLSAFAHVVPVFAFLLVFIVAAAILSTQEILGKSKWIAVFIAFFIASIFVATINARVYVETITPWFAAMLISLFFVLMLTSLVGKSADTFHKPIGIIFIILMGIIFIISGFIVFSNIIIPYLPGPSYGLGARPETLYFFDWFYSPPVLGTLILIIASAIVTWIVVKAK